jgi:hypothetical protein
MHRVPLLANEFVTVVESPDPASVYCYTPGIALLPSGRLVATMDFGGPGVAWLPGVKYIQPGVAYGSQGKVFTSDDGGITWVHRCDFPFMHARPFTAGNALYVLGHAGDLAVIRSDDEGCTWNEPKMLTSGQQWHQSSCNVWYHNDTVYLVMERLMDRKVPGWPVAYLAPVMMAGSIHADLTQADAWRFSNAVAYHEIVPKPVGLGIPFFPVGLLTPHLPDKRYMAPPGWLETNVVQFKDPNHIWFDPQGRTFYLWMRAHTGSTNLACIAKVTEDDQGSMTVSLAKTPSGEPLVYVPCPGGHMRFHILYDSQTSLFWLLSSQSTDSMIRPDSMPANRYNLPNNERHRLALYYSTNCMDWQMAGMVAIGETASQARHYASMAIDGDDLVVLSRSGDHRAKSAHDGNLITFHRVRNFRQLVY